VAEPTISTIKRLFALSRNRCAYPSCQNLLIDADGAFSADVCHIKGENPTAKRYDPAQSDKERRSIGNLIVLCRYHHGIIDDEDAIYSVEVLTEMKRRHEAKALSDVPFQITDTTAERIIAQMKGAAITGAVAGAAVAASSIVSEVHNFAKSFKELLGLSSDRPHSKPRRRDGAGLLIDRLRYGPAGLLRYGSTDSRHAGFGAAVAAIFKEAGWRIEPINMERVSEETVRRLRLDDRLLLSFVMRHDNLVPNAQRSVDEFFATLGFQPEGPETRVRGQAGEMIRISIGIGVRHH
jgi:hypothetical protein